MQSRCGWWAQAHIVVKVQVIGERVAAAGVGAIIGDAVIWAVGVLGHGETATPNGTCFTSVFSGLELGEDKDMSEWMIRAPKARRRKGIGQRMI